MGIILSKLAKIYRPFLALAEHNLDRTKKSGT